MSKTKPKQKYFSKSEFDDSHRSVRKQKSMYNKKQSRELDNVLKSRNAGKILSYSDDQF